VGNASAGTGGMGDVVAAYCIEYDGDDRAGSESDRGGVPRNTGS